MMTVWHKFPTAMAGIGLGLVCGASLSVHAADTQQAGLQVFDPSGVCASWTWGGSPAAPTLTCNAATPPVAGVPVCTIKANGSNPLTIASASLVTLKAECTNATGAGTNWAWDGASTVGNVTGASPQEQSVSVTGTTTFGVTATNGTGASVKKTVTVTLGASPPPPAPVPLGSIQEACSSRGYNNVLVMDMPWASQRLVSSGFGGDAVLVVRMNVPAGVVSSYAGSISLATNGTQDAIRNMTLTTNPCDFSPPLGGPLYNNSGYTMAPSLGFTVGADASYKYRMQAGTTYYLSVRHRLNDGSAACVGTSCDVNVNFGKPKGT